MYCSNLVYKVLYNRFDEGIQLETLALRFLYGGQITCTVANSLIRYYIIALTIEGIQLETLALRFLYGGQITCTVVTSLIRCYIIALTKGYSSKH